LRWRLRERIERAAKRCLGVRKRNSILRALGPGNRRHDRRQVKFEALGIARLGVRIVPKPLRLRIRLDQRNLLL
jgi:hypothetical protein